MESALITSAFGRSPVFEGGPIYRLRLPGVNNKNQKGLEIPVLPLINKVLRLLFRHLGARA